MGNKMNRSNKGAAAVIGLLLTVCGAPAFAGQPACPSADFKVFWQAFASDAGVQRAFVGSTLHSVTLKPAAEGMEPVSTTLPSGTLGDPLVRPGQSALELVDMSIQADTATVVDKRQGLSDMKVYQFRRHDCWTLEGVEDWSVDPRTLKVPAATASRTREQQVCYLKGGIFHGLGAAERYPLTSQLHEAALQNYLCAAASGDPDASWDAAALSLSQMAPYLGYEKTEALLLAAFRGQPEAGLPLAAFYCDGGVDTVPGQPCQAPSKAKDTLVKSAKRGSSEALTALGAAWETGRFEAPDQQRALGCYRQAAAQGDSDAKQALSRLGASQGAASNVNCY